MSEPKTKPTKSSVQAFIATLPDNVKHDAVIVISSLKQLTGAPPILWGTSIIGFGFYQYSYASGKTGLWPRIGMSPRKQNITIYIMPGFAELEPLLRKLGKHKISKSCLYIKRLSDIDLPTLKAIMKKSIALMNKKYPP